MKKKCFRLFVGAVLAASTLLSAGIINADIQTRRIDRNYPMPQQGVRQTKPAIIRMGNVKVPTGAQFRIIVTAEGAVKQYYTKRFPAQLGNRIEIHEILGEAKPVTVSLDKAEVLVEELNLTIAQGVKHPELREGEVFMGNISLTDAGQWNRCGWATKRRGNVAYNPNGDSLPGYYPVFVKISEDPAMAAYLAERDQYSYYPLAPAPTP